MLQEAIRNLPQEKREACFCRTPCFVPELLLMICVVVGTTDAQIQDTLWTRTFGGTNIDVGYSVQQTKDRGFVIAGYSRSYGTMNGRNAWLVKTDSLGNQQWNNAFGGNSDDEASAVRQTTDGGYIIAGYTKSSGAGGSDMLLIKTDSAGNEMWSRTFGGTQDDEAYSVQQTSDGGFIVAGATSSFGTAGSRDAWLVKTNVSGIESWRRSLGGFGSDGARSIEQTPDGGYVITGWTYSYGPGAVGNAWLVKTDTAGYATWNKFFGGSDVDRGYSLQQTSDSGYIIAGYTSSSGAGLDDLYLIKTNSAGDTLWTKTLGGTGRDYGYDIRQTMDGGYIIAGSTLSFGAGGDDVWLVKTNANGSQIWNATYGGSASDVAYSIDLTADGGCIVTGHTLSRGAGVHDVWLLRVASPTTGIRHSSGVAREYKLSQNYPNPFNPNTTIGFQITDHGRVKLSVFDVLGREVETLVNEEMTPGSYSVAFDGTNTASGVYFYQIRAGDFVVTKKLMLLR